MTPHPRWYAPRNVEEQRFVGAWRHYLDLYRGSAGEMVLATAGAVTQSLLLIPVALLIRHAFDRAMPAGDVTTLVWIGAGIAGLYIASGAVALWSRAVALRTTKRAIARLREELVAKVFALSRDTMVRADAGRTQGVIVHDTERIDVMSNEIVNQFVPALVFGVAIGIFLAYLNMLLFLAVLAVTPLLTIVLRLLSRAVRRRVTEFHASFETFGQGILFLLQRADLTRSLAAEDFEAARQSRNVADLQRVSATMAWWHTAHGIAQETITSASWALILVIGGVAVTSGSMTIGDVLSFSVAAMMLKRSVNTMVTGIPLIVEGAESLRTLDAFARQPDDVAYRGTERVRFEGRMGLHHVSFRYTEQPLLTGVDLTTEPGQLTVITGPSGSGKTTLLFLMLGFYRPLEGRAVAEGRHFDELDVRELRRSIGFVPQEPIVFAGTVLENLTYGSTSIDAERLTEATVAARADGFIADLPDGLETRVGEGGALLSGGQRQRLTIARALYRRPRLLLLDEPTNQLDDATARAIFENLRRVPGRPAIVIVTHDDGLAARYADEVLAVRGGRLEPVSSSARAIA